MSLALAHSSSAQIPVMLSSRHADRVRYGASDQAQQREAPSDLERLSREGRVVAGHIGPALFAELSWIEPQERGKKPLGETNAERRRVVRHESLRRVEPFVSGDTDQSRHAIRLGGGDLTPVLRDAVVPTPLVV